MESARRRAVFGGAPVNANHNETPPPVLGGQGRDAADLEWSAWWSLAMLAVIAVGAILWGLLA